MPDTERGRPPRKWTKSEDNIIRKNNQYGDNLLLSERFGCGESQIVKRRQFLKRKDEEFGVPSTLNVDLKSITARPLFFEENLDYMMKGRR